MALQHYVSMRLPYHVFHLRHGGGRSRTDRVEMGDAEQILDRRFLDGGPLPIVMGGGDVSYPSREASLAIVGDFGIRYESPG
ncbi:hypothetical protein ACQP1K_03600 [Sphaerimonospora sp. CA-214678]|uniref:hypothetical protein n=1 Tax=Sphaerimonospora sp. CA-214678 TaxID=3240029 RepID=UPI003D8DF9AE